MSAQPCPVCLAPCGPNETYCSKAHRAVARQHKASPVQHIFVPVSNEIDLVLRRKAFAEDTTVDRLVIDALQRGFDR